MEEQKDDLKVPADGFCGLHIDCNGKAELWELGEWEKPIPFAVMINSSSCLGDRAARFW